MSEEEIYHYILNPFRWLGHIILFIPSFIIWLLLIPIFLIGAIGIMIADRKIYKKPNWKILLFPFFSLYFGIVKQSNNEFFVFQYWEY